MADQFDQPNAEIANGGVPSGDAPAKAVKIDSPADAAAALSDDDFAALVADGAGIKVSEGDPAKDAQAPAKAADAPAPAADPAAPAPDAGKPAKAAAPKADKKFTGDLEGLDEPPPGLKQAASERYRKLVGAIHSRDAKIEKAEAELTKLHAIEEQAKVTSERMQNWEKYVAGTGASEQELATTFTYLSDLHSNDPNRMRRAFDMLQSELSGLSRILGIKPTGVDPLGAYPDLRQRVDNNEVDEDTALEIARLRANQDRVAQSQNAAAESARQTAAKAAAMETAQRGVQATLETFRKADPLYDSKIAQLEQSGTLAAIGKDFPPSAWGKAIEMAYRAVPGVVQRPAPSPQPLRANATGAPSVARVAPRSLDEALAEAITGGL